MKHEGPGQLRAKLTDRYGNKDYEMVIGAHNYPEGVDWLTIIIYEDDRHVLCPLHLSLKEVRDLITRWDKGERGDLNLNEKVKK